MEDFLLALITKELEILGDTRFILVKLAVGLETGMIIMSILISKQDLARTAPQELRMPHMKVDCLNARVSTTVAH